MKVLVLGSGGREHALALAIAKSPKLTRLLVAPGNPGCAPQWPWTRLRQPSSAGSRRPWRSNPPPAWRTRGASRVTNSAKQFRDFGGGAALLAAMGPIRRDP